MRRADQINAAYLVAAALLVLSLQWWWANSRGVAQIPYSRFETMLAEDQIASVRVGSATLEGELRQVSPEGYQRFCWCQASPYLTGRDLSLPNAKADS